MRLEQLISLVEISRHRSLNMASEKLHMTQQALSSSMKTLENELGVQILHRSRKGCTLTNDGEKLLLFANDILPRYQYLLDEFNAGTQPVALETLKGSLHIYVNSVFYLSLLADPIKSFCERHPQLEVSILTQTPTSICARLMEPAARNVHRIGFINAPCKPDGTPLSEFLPTHDVQFHPLAKGSYRACVGKDSPLASNCELSIKAILKHPLVLGVSDDVTSTSLYRLLARYGAPHIVLSVASLDMWNQAIVSNVGVGFLHDMFFEFPEYIGQYARDVEFIRIREKMTSVTGYLSASENDPVVNEFVRCLPTV